MAPFDRDDDEGYLDQLRICPECSEDMYDVDEIEYCDLCGQCPHYCGCPEPQMTKIAVSPPRCDLDEEDECVDCGFCYEIGPPIFKITFH